jgi:hypothetical protein
MLHFARPRGCHEASVYKFGLFKLWVHTKFPSNRQSFDEHVEPLGCQPRDAFVSNGVLGPEGLIGRGMTLQRNDHLKGKKVLLKAMS